MTPPKRKTFANTRINRAAGVAGKSYTPSTDSSSGRKRKRSETTSPTVSSKTRQDRKQYIQPTNAAADYRLERWKPTWAEHTWLMRPIPTPGQGHKSEDDDYRRVNLLGKFLERQTHRKEGYTEQAREALRILHSKSKRFVGGSRHRPGLLQEVSMFVNQHDDAVREEWMPRFRKEIRKNHELEKTYRATAALPGKTPIQVADALALARLTRRDFNNNVIVGKSYPCPVFRTATECGMDSREMMCKVSARTLQDHYLKRGINAYRQGGGGPSAYHDAKRTWDASGYEERDFFQNNEQDVHRFVRVWERERDIQKQYIDALPLPDDIKGLVKVATMHGPETKYVPLFKATWGQARSKW